jgi:nucleoside-diphosphate kinase
MERSLVLVKPDAMKRNLGCRIISRLEEAGARLVAVKVIHMDRKLAERHYAVHKGKPFFPGLINYITSTPVIAAVFQAENAIELIRKTMGPTDPAKAPKGTIRGDFGLNIEQNSIHGSDSVKTAEYEIAIYFREDEIFSTGY